MSIPFPTSCFPARRSLNKIQPETPQSADARSRRLSSASSSNGGPLPFPYPYPSQTPPSASVRYAANGSASGSGSAGGGGAAWVALPTSTTLSAEEARDLFGDDAPAAAPPHAQPAPPGPASGPSEPFHAPFDAFSFGSAPDPFSSGPTRNDDGFGFDGRAATVSALTAPPVLHPDRADFLDYAEAAR